jgi:hypothetical protein
MIGLFRTLLGRILESGARLTVVELKEELAGAADGYVVTLDADALLDCAKIVATGTLLLNDTLDRMLALKSGGRSEALKYGEKRSGVVRKFAITRDGYPGASALLPRRQWRLPKRIGVSGFIRSLRRLPRGGIQFVL